MIDGKNLRKLTLASMFAAMAFVCFAYLRIEIPMGGGMTGKIYIGHAFIILSALLLGGKYGALTGAVGLTLADILAGYMTSAPPTFLSKLLIGLSASFFAHNIMHLNELTEQKKIYTAALIASIGSCLVNVVTEPLIRYAFKVYILGYAPPVAEISSINCAISMAASAIPSVVIAVLLYNVVRNNLKPQEIF